MFSFKGSLFYIAAITACYKILLKLDLTVFLILAITYQLEISKSWDFAAPYRELLIFHAGFRSDKLDILKISHDLPEHARDGAVTQFAGFLIHVSPCIFLLTCCIRI